MLIIFFNPAFVLLSGVYDIEFTGLFLTRLCYIVYYYRYVIGSNLGFYHGIKTSVL